tara:strand:+ start:6108 stop:6827 length:720 start_codon:yes stop_codon:yes gene_type:complete
MTSVKRKYEDALASVEAPAAESASSFLYDPSSPAFPFKFMDELVSQHRERTRSAGGTTPMDLVCCPRAYEESFLREPVQDERQCMRGTACEGLKIACDRPFILREFIYPRPKSERNQQRGLCLMCRRLEIARLHFHAESSSCMTADVFVSDHYNIVGVPGEYRMQDCIVSTDKFTGLPMPVVLHVRSAYEYCERDGVRHYTQDHMCDPGDPNPNECSFLARGAILKARSVARSTGVGRK